MGRKVERGVSGVGSISAGLLLVTWVMAGVGSARKGDLLSASRLGSYNVDTNLTSVSGISSGGYMAVQMHVAFSESIMGAGVFAAGPYHCAQGSLNTATIHCLNSLDPNVDKCEEVTDSRSGGAIDNTVHLDGDRAFLLSGKLDTVVSTRVVESLQEYYNHYNVNVSLVKLDGAEHCQPTDNDTLQSCILLRSPYVSYCNYDGAGAALQWLYGNALTPKSGAAQSTVISFDQTEFGSQTAVMEDTGFIYVPNQCDAGDLCALHVAFHGCNMEYEEIGDAYVQYAGYNEWADANNLIILYPQATRSKQLSEYNPEGCWDWWGYISSDNYDTKEGKQMAAVFAMMERIFGQ
mmetsp:Transcript_9974/g.28040  ORF Transcript_9974/g.28040 Transcript_9974/m.28040 type:complete len:349 (+) Transcript_9974:66-1112(+)|eukprot:CAMPEP_0119119344 /NCGR_PEP_ID=MMETSP1310-20130426/872_1 /TAXON_ID=464262 /ORGANISM="Genus nov. species nov., Strain RCC2339" /LENGTH=348 /DNA_ID=CAMNT_0007108771 /DNA_START=65 /DNA_END=1111 /DNA_ORIENTATION=+